MTGDVDPILGGWRPGLALLCALGVLLAGCPQHAEDDDGDDDAGDDDGGDDDGGDDDAVGEGGGTWTTIGGPACGPVRSVVWLEYLEMLGAGGVYASSEPLGCQLWSDVDAALMASGATWGDAMAAATDAQDGAAACAATLAYLTESEQLWDTLSPPGSCLLELWPMAYTWTDYSIPTQAGGDLWSIEESWYASQVGYLTEACPGVSSWSDWAAVEAALWALPVVAAEIWSLTGGTLTLASGEDLHVTAAGLEIVDVEAQQAGTLDLDLQAAACYR